MNYENFSDDYLLKMINESSEEAKDAIFEKYRYIIDIEVKKYLNMASVLGYDYNDLYQDALLGFADALNGYRDDRNASLARFITVCVDRRLQLSIKKAGRIKNKLIADSLSLEYNYEQFSSPLRDLLSDNSLNDPLEQIVKDEKLKELLSRIKETLSAAEYEVYTLMISGLNYNEIALILNKTPKQVDNSMQRIKTKIKKILDER